jgi:RHS repeat-associated protein
MRAGGTDPDILRYRYTGQEYDTETGLYNYRARFYDGETGRFLSVDPKAQFASPYMAMGNNPVMMVDPAPNRMEAGV